MAVHVLAKSSFILLCAGSLIATLAAQQPKTTFEVVSIRPWFFRDERDLNAFAAGAGMCGLSKFTPIGNRVNLRGVNVCSLLRMAFDVKDYQIDAPAWITNIDPSVFFSIDARAKEGTPLTVEKARVMLQSMLEDRFKLTYHRAQRPAPVYALVVSPQGHKLRDLEPPCKTPGAPVVFTTAGVMTMCMSIAQFTVSLSLQVDRPVIDKTDLTGVYAIPQNWAGRYPWSPADPSDASVFTVLTERFGLRLDATNEPVDAVIIDHIERPTPN